MHNREELKGGREGKIIRYQQQIIRPANIWTKDVHQFLNFLHDKDISFVPKPITITAEQEEVISYMPGEVYNYPLPHQLLTEGMLQSAAALLLAFHGAGEAYITKLSKQEIWMLPVNEPVEVMCHGDFAPYNVTIKDNKAIGIIDFDTLHPGSKLWDLSYAIYRWVPLTSPSNPISNAPLTEKVQKVKLFLDSYGVAMEERASLIPILIQRLESLIAYMTSQAKDGNLDFQAHIDEGHIAIYLEDIEYMRINGNEITKGIMI